MTMIQIEESKVEKMSGLAEKMLKYGGKLMQCIEEMSEQSEGHMGQREWDDDDMDERGYGNRSYGGRGGYGNRYMDYGGGYGNRYMDMGERQGVKGTGPYSRYR